ncbi:hypothetical protein JHJ32_16510 [Parapedobacter sp. ISTM3]|uniref:Uncharacterized protein n=1 Tax=Parapedobacter luteus TaxID=623280 RepID=A0A1T5EV89_9SPHI|nr:MULTISPECIES: hypothetical protein [Parapedobacter]MBK1441603.1 hypothetical protein [Parapedobacter sp. ISTM3]SKB87758.1 hypothetical protein SAMN05660226_03583 [Parapedobacter luteus]
MKDKHTYNHVGASGTLPEALRVNPYVLPEGYFEDLQQRILYRCRHIDDPQPGFVVPEGYFEQLGDSMMAKFAEQKLKDMVDEAGFSAPPAYFADLTERLLAAQKLSKQTRETGFTVPTAYFDTLQDRITNRVLGREMAPVRKINRPRWMVYAAAACFAVIISVAGLLRLTDDSRPNAGPLASVSDQEILNYLELYGTADDVVYISEHLDDFDKGYIGEGLSEEDIEAYLNHTL